MVCQSRGLTAVVGAGRGELLPGSSLLGLLGPRAGPRGGFGGISRCLLFMCRSRLRGSPVRAPAETETAC